MPLVDDKWRHIKSPNFELYSHDSDYVSRNLLRDLELLRAVFVERFKFVERARVDVTVYLFRTVDEFTLYGYEGWKKGHNFRGFYMEGKDRATISVAPAEDVERARALIFHEYVHHLFRAAGEEPTLWFNEGMAEVLGGIRLELNTVEIGRPHTGRLFTLTQQSLLPLEVLFSVNHGSPIYRSNDHTGLFYAESWALLHYWYFGDSGLPKEAIARFTRVAGNQQLAAKVDLRAFFRECFGMDYPEMQRRLERYVSSGSYRYGREKAPVIEPVKSYATRAVPREEIRLRLAELALRTNRSPMAKFLLLDAGVKPGAEPRLLEVLGSDALLERDESTAQDRWEQAIAAGSTNMAIYRELGLLESRAWFRSFNYDFRIPVELATRLRERLNRAIKHEPTQSAPYEMLAWVEAYSEVPDVDHVNLIQRRFSSLKQKARTLVALSLIRARAGRTDEAKAMLSDLDKLEQDDWADDAAEVILARIEKRHIRTPQERKGEAGVLAEEGGLEVPVKKPRPLKIPPVKIKVPPPTIGKEP